MKGCVGSAVLCLLFIALSFYIACEMDDPSNGRSVVMWLILAETGSITSAIVCAVAGAWAVVESSIEAAEQRRDQEPGK